MQTIYSNCFSFKNGNKVPISELEQVLQECNFDSTLAWRILVEKGVHARECCVIPPNPTEKDLGNVIMIQCMSFIIRSLQSDR
jgi:hypothetical protein